MPDVAQGLSAERVSDGRRPAGLHSTEATQATGNNDSELVADERSSTVVGASSAERSQVAEGASEPLTRDDLSLAPKDSLSPEHHGDDSIYGLETDPMDSQLDLARAYLDMGDDESARPVLTLVIEQGSLTQQAEARALLNRLDVS
jgi:pilus assembly protein FimV